MVVSGSNRATRITGFKPVEETSSEGLKCRVAGWRAAAAMTGQYLAGGRRGEKGEKRDRDLEPRPLDGTSAIVPKDD